MQKNFVLLEHGVDTAPFLEEIRTQRDAVLLKEYSSASAHHESKQVMLRDHKRGRFSRNRYHGNLFTSIKTDSYEHFPRITGWMEDFAARRGGDPQFAFIAILKPHGKVRRHFDAGMYYATVDMRYHLVLQSEGTRVVVEEETAIFRQGEVWQFDNNKFHEFFHESDGERIHLIFDLRPRSWLQKSRNAAHWLRLFIKHKTQRAGKRGAPSSGK